MNALKLRINPDAEITWHPIGQYGTTVLQVDNFLEQPDEVRAFALSLAYSVPQDYYPGLRSYATLDGAADLTRWVGERMLERLFPEGGPPPEICLQGGTGCMFSVKAFDTEVPPNFHDQHADSLNWMATVLHLSHVEQGRGTAFWEHRPSGLQHWARADPIMNRRLEATLGLRLGAQLDRAFARGIPLFEAAEIYSKLFARNPARKAFSAREDADWKLLKLVPARFNRLVAYPAWQLHSIVDELPQSQVSLQTARLTINQFLFYPFESQTFKSELPGSSPYPLSAYRHVDGLVMMHPLVAAH
jgi:hypothetical protein